MDSQQLFGERLLALLNEKNISQGEFAEAVGCTRQSVNFYILGKRSPDISTAAEMARVLGVSCDYLIGFSDFRADKSASLTVNQAGLSENTAKFFAGLKLLSNGVMLSEDVELARSIGMDYENEWLPGQKEDSKETLALLNGMIEHDRFGVLLQYVKRYRDISRGTDDMAVLKDFMLKLESPVTGAVYGSTEENTEMMKEFCLHVAAKYFEEIVKEVAAL